MSEEITNARVEHKQQCWQAYMKGIPQKEICEELGANPHTLRSWIKKEKWVNQREELINESNQNFYMQQRRLILSNRIKVSDRHLKLSEKIEDKIMQALERKLDNGEEADLSDEELLNLARAAKQSSDIGARAVGLSDKVDPLFSGGGGGTNIIATPGSLINIGVQPKLPSEVKDEDIPEADVQEVPSDSIPFG